MFDSIKELEELEKQRGSISEKIKDEIITFIQNGINYAYEKNRFLVLPGVGLDDSSFFSAETQLSCVYRFGISHLHELIKNEVNKKLELRYLISGDTSTDSIFSKRFFTFLNDCGLTFYKSNTLTNHDSVVADLFRNSDICIHQYFLDNVNPQVTERFIAGSVEKVKSEDGIKDISYYLPMKLYKMFLDNDMIDEECLDIILPVLVVFEDVEDPENLYFGLLLFNSSEIC